MFIRMKVNETNRKLADRLVKAEGVKTRWANKKLQTVTVRVHQSFIAHWTDEQQKRLNLLGAQGNEKWYEFS